MSMLNKILVILSIFAVFIITAVIVFRGIKSDARNKRPKKTYNQARFGIQPDVGIKGRFLDKRDWTIMAVMSAVYFLIAIIYLGGFSVPHAWWKPAAESDVVVIDFGSKTEISRIAYNPIAVQHSENDNYFKLEYLDDNGNFTAMNEQIKDKDFFKWKYVSVKITTSKIRLTPVKAGAAITDNVDMWGFGINEIGFFAQDSTVPISGLSIASGPAGAAALIDEQSTVADKNTLLNGTYFDEIYFARTAWEHIYGYKIYETTHPPLGKSITAIGILIFGMNTFGWRIMNMLFGVLMIPLMYIFGKRIFNDRFYAFIAAFLMMFDFMHFTQTRISTIDGYVVFFIIVMYYFLYKFFMSDPLGKDYEFSVRQLFLCGIAFGLGVSTKWIALYAAAGLAFIYILINFANLRHHLSKNALSSESGIAILKMIKVIGWSFLFFIFIPAIFYAISYLPYFRMYDFKGNFVKIIVDSQNLMFWYHSQQASTHPWQSSWWTWPFDIRPIKYFAGGVKTGYTSVITALGNPLIWWTGACSFVAAVIIALKKSDKRMVVIFVALLCQFFPWIFITRSTFIYHYFSIVPFMILCIVYVINHLLENGIIPKWTVYTFLALVALLFVIYYPALSGVEVPSGYIPRLNIFTSWGF